MRKRSVAGVILFSLITLGIYAIVWQVKTKIEMNSVGAAVPTAWLMIIPIVNIWWLWKFSEGVEVATNKEMSGPIAFILLFLLGIIGMAILQVSLNKVATR